MFYFRLEAIPDLQKMITSGLIFDSWQDKMYTFNSGWLTKDRTKNEFRKTLTKGTWKKIEALVVEGNEQVEILDKKIYISHYTNKQWEGYKKNYRYR